MRLLLSAVSGFIAGVLLTSIYLFSDLEKLSNLAQLIVALSVIIALLSYLYQKKKDNAAVVGELVRFFRVEIIPLNNNRVKELIKFITEKEEVKEIKEIEDFSFKWFHKERFKDTKAQYMLKKSLEKKLGNNHDEKTLNLLNALEEFSIKIEAYELEKVPELAALRSAFVQMVNECALYVPWVRKRYDNPNIYASLTKIYAKWYPTVKMRSSEEIADEVEQELTEKV